MIKQTYFQTREPCVLQGLNFEAIAQKGSVISISNSISKWIALGDVNLPLTELRECNIKTRVCQVKKPIKQNKF